MLVFALLLQAVLGDLPVHCLHHQVAGEWIFHIGRYIGPDGEDARCGFDRPDTPKGESEEGGHTRVQPESCRRGGMSDDETKAAMAACPNGDPKWMRDENGPGGQGYARNFHKAGEVRVKLAADQAGWAASMVPSERDFQSHLRPKEQELMASQPVPPLGTGRGFWTMIYNEGFHVNLVDTVESDPPGNRTTSGGIAPDGIEHDFVAFSWYKLDKGTSPGSSDWHKNAQYSNCAQTLVGWYHRSSTARPDQSITHPKKKDTLCWWGEQIRNDHHLEANKYVPPGTSRMTPEAASGEAPTEWHKHGRVELDKAPQPHKQWAPIGPQPAGLVEGGRRLDVDRAPDMYDENSLVDEAGEVTPFTLIKQPKIRAKLFVNETGRPVQTHVHHVQEVYHGFEDGSGVHQTVEEHTIKRANGTGFEQTTITKRHGSIGDIWAEASQWLSAQVSATMSAYRTAPGHMGNGIWTEPMDNVRNIDNTDVHSVYLARLGINGGAGATASNGVHPDRADDKGKVWDGFDLAAYQSAEFATLRGTLPNYGTDFDWRKVHVHLKDHFRKEHEAEAARRGEVVTAVDQGPCGSCYDVAVASMLTSRLWIRYPELMEAWKGHGDGHGERDRMVSWRHNLHCNQMNQGCEGGYPYYSLIWGLDVDLPDSKCYPHTASPEEAQQKIETPFGAPDNDGVKQQTMCDGLINKDGQPCEYAVRVHRFGYVGGAYGLCSVLSLSAKQYPNLNPNQFTCEFAMRAEIYRGGPIGVAIEPSSQFGSHTNGVFKCGRGEYQEQGIMGDTPTAIDQWRKQKQAGRWAQIPGETCPEGEDCFVWERVDHAIIAIGWGVYEDDTPYWIVQNSWGETWNDGEGTMLIERGTDCMSIESITITADPVLVRRTHTSSSDDIQVKCDGGACRVEGGGDAALGGKPSVGDVVIAVGNGEGDTFEKPTNGNFRRVITGPRNGQYFPQQEGPAPTMPAAVQTGGDAVRTVDTGVQTNPWGETGAYSNVELADGFEPGFGTRADRPAMRGTAKRGPEHQAYILGL